MSHTVAKLPWALWGCAGPFPGVEWDEGEPLQASNHLTLPRAPAEHGILARGSALASGLSDWQAGKLPQCP